MKKYKSESAIDKIIGHVKKGFEIAFEEKKLTKGRKQGNIRKQKMEAVGMSRLDL